MIYIVLHPTTIWEKLNYQIRGIAPSICCDSIRNGVGVVECLFGEDQCTMIPMGRVMQISWESGYKQAFEQSRNQYFADMAASMKQMVGPNPSQCGCGDEGDDDDCTGPYVATNATPEGYN